jgi:hypothetical protein
MYAPADRPAHRRDTVLVLICLGLSIAALMLPAPLAGRLAGAIRDTALAPLIWLQTRAEEGRTSRARFSEVVAARDSALVTAMAVDELRAENDRLRVLLQLPGRAPGEFVAAEVLRQTVPTDGRTLLLSAGRRQGARPYHPVVTPAGLLGVIAQAGLLSSIATTWAHPEFRVAGVTDDGAVLGIVAPAAGADPTLTILEFRGTAYRDTVPDGTLVLTAGMGGVYPRGIPIGRVHGVRREEAGWERVYQLEPMVNPGVVTHVLLLVRQRDTATALIVDVPP